MDVFDSPYLLNAFTWLCLSFVLIVAVFFRFGRVWSLRNLDLLLLLLVSPALLFVANVSGTSTASDDGMAGAVQLQPVESIDGSIPPATAANQDSEAADSGTGAENERSENTAGGSSTEVEGGTGETEAQLASAGTTEFEVAYGLLFAITGLLLLRLLADPFLRRRPHLVPNLNAQGSAFLCVAALLLLTLQAFHADPTHSTRQTLEAADQMLQGREASDSSTGPALRLIAAPIQALFEDYAPRAIAVFSHLLVFLGLVFVGRNLFGDVQLGLGMATLYLLLPCTAFTVEEVNHVLPAALTLWALVAYRRPMVSGALLGLACGIMFFPVFLIPLWLAFYGRRGIVGFIAALLLIGSIVCSTVALTSAEFGSFISHTFGTINFEILSFEMPTAANSFWNESLRYYRIPVIVSFFLLLIGLTFWPRRKNVEHLVSASATILIATQFWYPLQGGVYVLWYLPLLLVAMFRPRLVHLQRNEDPAGSQAQRSSQMSGAHARGVAKSSKRLHLFR